MQPPPVQSVIGGCEGHAKDDEQEVSHSQIEDEHVGRVAHGFVLGHYSDDQGVADAACIE